jgi:hypothetical protein
MHSGRGASWDSEAERRRARTSGRGLTGLVPYRPAEVEGAQAARYSA